MVLSFLIEYLSFLLTSLFYQNWFLSNEIAFIKGGLSAQIVFKCFRVIFSLKKKTNQLSLSFNLYFQQKRAPKLSICHLPTKCSVWVFNVTDGTNGFSTYQSYHELVMSLFNSLAKSCMLF